jgi:DNA-directed RNA polymerase subunit RPC12/RpoP
MNKLVLFFLAFVAVGLIFMGLLFIIGSAGLMANLLIGLGMLIGGALIFAVLMWMYKLEMSKPTVVQQTFNVQMGASGKLEEKQLKCRSCGAPLESKDLTVVQGGMMVKCPYCNTAYTLEEAPKW